MNYKKGFTLAEVLITLGIIGVVAAMTIPTLIKEYQKHVLVNQLKKSINIVENGFKLAMAKDEVDDLSDTELFKSLGDAWTDEDEVYFNKFVDEFKKYFKVIKTKFSYDNSYGYKQLNGQLIEEGEGDLYSAIYLLDGIILYTKFDRYVDGSFNRFEIDTNGEKGPNQYGRDIFNLGINKNGTLNIGDSEDCSRGTWGRYCAGRIIENGWKMDY